MLRREFVELMQRHKWRSVSVLVGIGILAFLWAGSLTNSYSDCTRGHEADYPDYDNPRFSEVTSTFIVCEGVAGNENGELLTALGTIAVAAFTLTLWLSSNEQARLTRESIELARQEYVSSHRPKLKMRLLRIGKLAIGESITLQYEVVNIGDTKATIVCNEIVLQITNIPDSNGKYGTASWAEQFSFADKLVSGESAIAKHTMAVKFDRSWTLLGAEPEPEWAWDRVEIIGTIAYADDNGTTRRMGFYRICSADVNRFSLPDFNKTTLDDYEYQD